MALRSTADLPCSARAFITAAARFALADVVAGPVVRVARVGPERSDQRCRFVGAGL